MTTTIANANAATKAEIRALFSASDLMPLSVLDRLWGFSRAQKITIGAAAGAGTGYQVPLTVDYTTAYNDGITIGLVPAKVPAANDSGSLRFYTIAGVPIPMFVESVDETSAIIWLKVPDDISTTAFDFYLLDNGDASSANVSDGDSVFELYDHFNAGVLDTAKWDATFATGVTFAGAGQAAYALFTGANAQRGLKSVASFGDGYEMYVSGRYPNSSAGGDASIVGFDAQYYFYNPSTDTTLSYIGKGAYHASNTSHGSRISNSANYTVRAGRNGGTGRVIAANNVGISVTTNSSSVSTTAAVAVANCVYATGTTARINYAFVKKFVATEPAITAVIQLVGRHNHSSATEGGTALAPSGVVCAGQISAIEAGAGGFAYTAQPSGVMSDTHGLRVNVKPAAPGTTNYIGNIRYTVNDLSRWTIKKQNDLESGSDAGSSLYFAPHADAGGVALDNLAPIMSRDGRFSIASVPPASAAAAGRAGTIAWDASFIYICTATNTWKRVGISTW
jgi:hypothetical protein